MQSDSRNYGEAFTNINNSQTCLWMRRQSLNVLHCFIFLFYSAGVGRSGVFITLSIVLERMRYEGSIDQFQTVKMLRTQRQSMVQTEVSFVFVTQIVFL